MASPFKVRQRVLSYWKWFKQIIFNKSTSSTTNPSESLASELAPYCQLAGSFSELNAILEWARANPEIKEVSDYATPNIGTFSSLLHETNFARMIRRYELENKLDKRVLGDEEINGILEGGFSLRVVSDDDSSEFAFAYTVGNSTQTPPIPELLSFYPSINTVEYILNYMTDLFIKDAIKPLQSGEIREIHGLINPPVRVWLMEGDDRKTACEKWTTIIPEDSFYPLLFVDIPDTNGYYFWESECKDDVKRNYPDSMAKTGNSSVQYLPFNSVNLPCSADAASLCIRAARNGVQNTEEENGRELNKGTLLVLLNMESWADPTTWVQDDQEIIEDNYRLLVGCSFDKGAREWVNDELFNRGHDPHEIAFDWSLPKPDGPASNPQLDEIGFEEHYSNFEELLNDIQWDIVTTAIIIALQNCNDSETVDFLRGLYAEAEATISKMIDE